MNAMPQPSAGQMNHGLPAPVSAQIATPPQGGDGALALGVAPTSYVVLGLLERCGEATPYTL